MMTLPNLKTSLRRLKPCGLALIAACGFAQQAQADMVETIPIAWRLSQYSGGLLEMYFTGSTCAQGALTVPSSATDAVGDRLWATIVTAKADHLPVGVYYHVDGGQCLIDTYYLKETS